MDHPQVSHTSAQPAGWVLKEERVVPLATAQDRGGTEMCVEEANKQVITGRVEGRGRARRQE